MNLLLLEIRAVDLFLANTLLLMTTLIAGIVLLSHNNVSWEAVKKFPCTPSLHVNSHYFNGLADVN